MSQELKKKREQHISGICELFINTFHLTQFYFYSCLHVLKFTTIFIPICTEVWSANIFLFPYAGKINICWTLVCSVQCAVCSVKGCLASIPWSLLTSINHWERGRHWETGTLGHWDIVGTFGYWDTGTLGHFGTLQYYDTGTLVHWDTGTLGYWDTGTLGYWDTGTLGHSAFGTLEY